MPIREVATWLDLGHHCNVPHKGDPSALSEPALIRELTKIISCAAAVILSFDQAKVAQREKADHSPVTAADEAANEIILHGLTKLLPGVTIVTEEGAGFARPGTSNDCYLLVDPLDGTREFLAGRNEFTVNIAVVLGGRAQVGLIVAPALGLVWRGVVGRGAERLCLGAADGGCALHTRALACAGAVVAVSRSHLDAHTEEFLQRLDMTARVPCGSSLKFCRIAEGVIDIYPRLAQTHEWDIAAGQAILSAAGGIVTQTDGTELLYGSDDSFKNPGFIAWGDPAAARAYSDRC